MAYEWESREGAGIFFRDKMMKEHSVHRKEVHYSEGKP
jgi:hypothetical protein